MTKGKKPVRHHDILEEVLSILRMRSVPVTVMHENGHNQNVYNDAADELAKAGVAWSKVHRPVWPRKAPDDGPRGRKSKQTRGRVVKRQASVQVSDESTDSDRSRVMCHRRRGMRNAPLELPDPEADWDTDRTTKTSMEY